MIFKFYFNVKHARVDSIHENLRYKTYLTLERKRNEEAKEFNMETKKIRDAEVERLRNADIPTKRVGIDNLLGKGGEYGNLCAELLQRVVGEINIRDLESLGLYVIPKEQGEQDHPKGEKAFIPPYDLGSFDRIPNVKDFSVTVLEYDGLLALFNIKKRTKPILNIIEYKNKKMNRYIEHQTRRLDKCLEEQNNVLYGRISMFLVKRSKIYYLMQLNKAFPNGHRDRTLWGTIKLYKEYLTLCREESLDVKLARVFIEKKGNKLRPLGVPSPAGRLYLGLINRFAQHFLTAKISEGQHAYVRNKGTLSAGKQIAHCVINAQNVYEFDLKGFFDSLDILKLKRLLEKKGIPSNVSSMLFAINTKIPEKGVYSSDSFKDIIKLSEETLKKMVQSEPIARDPDGVGSFPHAESEMYVNVKIKGMAQGSALSPLLSVIALEETLFKMFPGQIVMYADDGIVYGDENLTINEIKKRLSKIGYGIMVNGEKSDTVKENGIGLKPLKFLGLEYDGKYLKANTRKGSQLVMDKQKLVDIFDTRLLERLFGQRLNPKNKPDMARMVDSNLGGLIQNRLYSGSGDMLDIFQNFQLTFIEGSGLYYRKRMRVDFNISVFTASSFALHSLYKKIKKIKYSRKHHKYDDGAYITPTKAPDMANMKMSMDSRLLYPAMNDAIEMAEMEKQEEAKKYINPNRRERKGTPDELKRRLTKPPSLYTGPALYNFLKGYKSVISPDYEDESISDFESLTFNEETGIYEEKAKIENKGEMTEEVKKSPISPTINLQFDEYPLTNQKELDFELFRKLTVMMEDTKSMISNEKDRLVANELESVHKRAFDQIESSKDLANYVRNHISLIVKRRRVTIDPKQVIRRFHFPDVYFFSFRNPLNNGFFTHRSYYPPIDAYLLIRCGQVSTNIVKCCLDSLIYVMLIVVIPVVALIEWLSLKQLDILLSDPKPTISQTVILSLMSCGYIGLKQEEITEVWGREGIYPNSEIETSAIDPTDKESNLPIILFIGLASLICIFSIFHSEVATVTTQNSLLESIVRDQASIIEGQKLAIEAMMTEMSKGDSSS